MTEQAERTNRNRRGRSLWRAMMITMLGAGGLAPGCSCGADESQEPEGGGRFATPEEVMTELLTMRGAAQPPSPWVAYVTAAPLAAKVRVTPAEGQSAFVPTNRYWFAYVDEDPWAEYEHPGKFTFVDAQSGAVTEETQRWWPELAGKGLVVSDVDLVRLFSPAIADESLPSPAAQPSAEQPLAWAIRPDFTAGTAEGRFAFDAAGGGYLNVVADIDGSGTFGASKDGPEWLVQNLALPTGAGWTWSEPFAMPEGSDGKFAPRAWVRAVVSSTPIDATAPGAAGWDGVVPTSAKSYDVFFDLRTWAGPDSEAGAPAGLIGPRRPDVGKSAGVTGAPCKYFCQPEDKSIDTLCKALVINLGDAPGMSWMHRNLEKAYGFFELRLGTGATETMDRPTAEEASARIKSFMQGLSCLDTAHLYITGHGDKKGRFIHAANGDGSLRVSDVHGAITSAKHCASPMDFYSGGCRMGGYCDLNVTIQSCFSGNFLTGADSIGLPGINVLTSADDQKSSYGCGDGSCVSNALWEAFTDDRADKPANGGNGDGVTTPAEAMEYAKQHYDDYKATARSNPQSAYGADCACTCSAPACDPKDPKLSRAASLLGLMQQEAALVGSGCMPLTILKILHSAANVASKLVAHDHTTLRFLVTMVPVLSQVLVDKLFNNSDFPCGAGPNGYTLCPKTPSAVPPGDHLVLLGVMEGNVPTSDPANQYQYGFVFDADGVTTNNYQPTAQYPNDFFKGTDRWYEAAYHPSSGWSLEVTDATGGSPKPMSSNARLIVSENVVALVVPKAEFSAQQPRYRVTAFRHKGDYGMQPPHDWDGSVWPEVASGLAEIP